MSGYVGSLPVQTCRAGSSCRSRRPLAPVSTSDSLNSLLPSWSRRAGVPVAPVDQSHRSRLVVPFVPLAPVGPVTPVGPVEPVAPLAPAAPAAPVAPVGPVAPFAPFVPFVPLPCARRSRDTCWTGGTRCTFSACRAPVGPVGPVAPFVPFVPLVPARLLCPSAQ